MHLKLENENKANKLQKALTVWEKKFRQIQCMKNWII